MRERFGRLGDALSPIGRLDMWGWHIAASVLLHVLSISILEFLPGGPSVPSWPETQSIAIEILSAAEFDAIGRTVPSAPPASAPIPRQETTDVPASPGAEPQTSAVPDMVRATALLGERNLASPFSRQARTALRRMTQDDRIDQLCAIEASEQIQAWNGLFQPDRLVSFALGDTRIEAGAIIAEGAAFRSKGNWYRLEFRCGLSSDRTKVAGFEFRVGDAIPREQWDALGLPPIY